MIPEILYCLSIMVFSCSLIVTEEAYEVEKDDNDNNNSEEIENPCPWVCKKLLNGQNEPFSCNETIWIDEPSWIKNWDYKCNEDDYICCQPWPNDDDLSIHKKCDEKSAEGYRFECAKSSDCPSNVATYDFACFNVNEACCVITDTDDTDTDDTDTDDTDINGRATQSALDDESPP